MKQALQILWLVAWQVPALAQVLTLDSVFNSIDRNHPELKMYEAQASAFDAYAAGARALDAPQAGAGLFMTPYNPQMWKGDPMSGNPGMGSFMLSAQQMFMNPRKLSANAKYMAGMSAVEREMRNSSRNELFAMARMAYYEWIVLKKKLRIIAESESLLTYLIKVTEIRYTYGMDKLTAYYKAKAMLGDMQNMRLMTSSEIELQRTQLTTLMNRGLATRFDIDTNVAIQDYESYVIDTARLGAARSDYRALGENINLLRSKQNFERSKGRPDIGIRYDHMIGFGKQPQQFSLMAMVSVPIVPWSSKMYRSAVRGLDFEAEAMKNRQQVILNESSGELARLQQQLVNKKQQLALFDKVILPAMRQNFQSNRVGYEQNTEELFMVLDAWQNLKLAQLAALDLVKELYLLQAAFEKELQLK
jgi:outer membrane protein, heavy metal efflux system